MGRTRDGNGPLMTMSASAPGAGIVQSIGHKVAQRWCNGRGVYAGVAAVAHSDVLVPRGSFARRRRNRRGEFTLFSHHST
jgi:hypothetical protein